MERTCRAPSGRKWESVKARASTLGFTHNKAWSKEDDEWIRSVYDTMDIDEIAKRVGRDKQAVLVHARSIGLYKGARRNIWDDDKINFLIRNYEIMDRNEIAGKLGIAPHQVTNKAAKLGLKKDLHKKYCYGSAHQCNILYDDNNTNMIP